MSTCRVALVLALLAAACTRMPSPSPGPALPPGPTVALAATTFADPDIVYRIAGTTVTYHLRNAIVRIATDGHESSTCELDVTDGADHATLRLPPDATWHGLHFALGTANFGHADITVSGTPSPP